MELGSDFMLSGNFATCKSVPFKKRRHVETPLEACLNQHKIQVLQAENELLLQENRKLKVILDDRSMCCHYLSKHACDISSFDACFDLDSPQSQPVDLRVQSKIGIDLLPHDKSESISYNIFTKPKYIYAVSSSSPFLSQITDLDGFQSSSTTSSLIKFDETTGSVVQLGVSREQLIKLPCPICTDRVSGFHYGIPCCNSCNLFFKRSVQNKKVYICLETKSCMIDKPESRNHCQFCRLQKCFASGMNQDAVGMRKEKIRALKSN